MAQKILLADDILAYVGSVNMLGSSKEISMEAGICVDGQSVKHVSLVIDSILNISKKCLPQ